MGLRNRCSGREVPPGWSNPDPVRNGPLSTKKFMQGEIEAKKFRHSE